MQQFLLQHCTSGRVILWRPLAFESINFWPGRPWVFQQPISLALSQQALRHAASFSFRFSYRTSEHLSSALSGESVLYVLARAGSISSVLGSVCSFMGFTHAEGDLCTAGCLNQLPERETESHSDSGRHRVIHRDRDSMRETETQGDSWERWRDSWEIQGDSWERQRDSRRHREI